MADRCELTFLERIAIAFETLERQHRAYCDALELAGADVIVLDADPTLADSVFIEDAAVVLDEVAIMTRPGAMSRRPEPDRIETGIRSVRNIARIVAPGTLEGGDVLRIGRKLYIGLTTRTNREGVEQFAALVRPFAYEVVAVPVTGSLHLKTACTALDTDTVLINRDWLDSSVFADYRCIEVADDEPFAANVLPVGNALIANASCPRTLERIGAHARFTRQRVVPVDISEFGKAEAGLTCMSLVFTNYGESGG